MIVQAVGVASIGDGVKIEVESLGLGEQDRRELGDPAGDEFFLVCSLRAIGIVGGEGFFGQDVEASEEAQSAVKVEVINMAVTFFVEEFQNQETEQGVDSGDHLRAWIFGVTDEAVEAELSQERQKQESTGKARVE